jgi:hypothetical protein
MVSTIFVMQMFLLTIFCVGMCQQTDLSKQPGSSKYFQAMEPKNRMSLTNLGIGTKSRISGVAATRITPKV